MIEVSVFFAFGFSWYQTEMNLKESFDWILHNPHKWNYYNPENVDYECFIHLFEDEKIAYDFICRYFRNGEKEQVVPTYCKSMVGRWTHTISVYLLGIYIGETVLGVDFRNEHNLYLWYITCLYHDCGYVFENKKNNKQFNHSIEKTNIAGYPILDTLEAIYRETECEFEKQTVLDYYEMRYANRVVDHGIAGGILLFGKLNDILRHNLRDNPMEINNGVLWHYRQSSDFAICANAIITHNMWFNQKYSIEELRFQDGEKHVYKNWLTALLVLCDTIEPIKRYPCCKPSVVLENIFVEFSTNQIIIDMKKWKCCIYEVLEKQCKSLEEWTYIAVKCRKGYLVLDNVNSILVHN